MDKGLKMDSIIFSLILFTIFFSPIGKGGEAPWAVFIRQSSIVLITCIWIIAFMKKKNPSFRFLGLEVPITSFLCLCLISYFLSNYRYSTQLEITKIIIYLFYLFVCVQILNRSRISFILWSIVLSSVIQAIFIMAQRYIYGIGPPEVKGTFFNPNYAANFMLLGANIAFLKSLWIEEKRGWVRWLMRFFGLLIIWGIILTGSRSVALALIFLVCFHVIISGRKWIPLLVGCFLIIWIIPNPVGDRLLYFRFYDESDMHPLERIEIWKGSIKVMLDHPLLGVSLGNFEDHTYPYNFPVDRLPARYGMRFTTAHNGLLQIGAEMGIPGLISILWILYTIFKNAFLVFRDERRDKKTGLYLYIASTSLIAIAIPAIMSDSIYSPPIVLLALTMTAIISYLSSKEEGNILSHSRRWGNILEGKLIIIPLCSLLLVVMIVCLWPFLCLNPYIGNIYFNKAWEDLKKGDLERAERLIRKAIYFSPEQPYYYQFLGRINLFKFERYPSEENIKNAISNFSRAIDINSRQPDFSFNMAKALELARSIAYRTEGLDIRIINYYENAISLAPKNPFYPFHLAIFYLKINRLHQAINYLNMAISIEPNFINAHYFLSHIYRKQNLMEKAKGEEMILSSLMRRFENYKPRSRYEELLFMRPEFLFRKEGVYGKVPYDSTQ
jgi:O-antigen ligase/tetratricopeptide (TPR) repeat protein